MGRLAWWDGFIRCQAWIRGVFVDTFKEHLTHFAQSIDALDLAGQQHHAARRQCQFGFDLLEVTGLHHGACGKERIAQGLARNETIHDQLMRVNVQLAQFGHGTLRLFDRNRFGMQHEDKRGLGRIAHDGHGPLVLVLGVLNRGGRPDARLPAAFAGRIDRLAPFGGQFQQAQRVTGRRGVEDHDVKDLPLV